MTSRLGNGVYEGALVVVYLCLALLAYTWLLYPALLWGLKKLFARLPEPRKETAWPTVSIIIAAHNEASSIAEKLEDCLQLQYPSDLLEIVVVSDGSTDATESVVREFSERDPRVRLLRVERAGKSEAQNRAVEISSGEILLFTDVNTRTRPELLEQLARRFPDPKVGLVSGTVHLGLPNGAIGGGQGLYWRFEIFLRTSESALGLLATGSGQALAMRRSLFRPMPSIYGDDCILPLDVRLQGFRVEQDPYAIVFDTIPGSVEGELKARIRMTSRNWTGTLSCLRILNPFRFPLTAWALLSHKLLRWLTPIYLILLLLCNSLLLLRGRYIALWVLQVLFYLGAFVGWTCIRKSLRAGWFGYPFSFCLANLGFFLGLVTVVRGQKIAVYQSTR